MAYFDCIVGGSGKGNTLVVSCADDLAGATITCTNGTKTYTKTCPSTSPYEVTFYGLMAGTWTVSATVSGDTYTTTVVITDYEAELGGFNWKTWVDLSKNYTSSDFTDLDELLDTKLAVRELMSIHACVDYLAGIAAESADVETIIGNDLCAKWINNRDYALDTLYANEIIAGYMDTADKYFYGEWVITDNTTTPPTWGAKGNVPIMTANNAPYGTASASSEYNANNAAWKAFNGVLTDWWSCTQDQTNPNITCKFTNPTAVKRVRHWQNENGGCSCKIRYSDDGITFTDVPDSQYTTIVNGWVTKDISNVGYHLYWNVYFNNLTNHFSSSNIQFYGRELTVSVPTMTGNTTPYGEVKYSSAQNNSSDILTFGAFDNNASTAWACASNDSDRWCGYDFGKKVKIKAIYQSSRSAYPVTTYKIQASNTGSADDWSDITESLSNKFESINPTDAYRYWRLKCLTGGSGNVFTLDILQFYGFDYSEKEFEEGTTKKWLYDHGVELETLTPWANPTMNQDLADITDEYIRIKKQVSTAANVAVRTNLIDLTPYSLVRCIAGNVLNASNGILFITSIENPAPSQAADALSRISTKYNNSLVISNFNQSKYVEVGFSSNTIGDEIHITELWLE